MFFKLLKAVFFTLIILITAGIFLKDRDYSKSFEDSDTSTNKKTI